tara:strand:- start:5257 stop:5838 length:582 start_codon:yes stop_codon:yes gene_type:complete
MFKGLGKPSQPFKENSNGMFSSRRGTNTPGGALWGYQQTKNKYGTTAACCNSTDIQSQIFDLRDLGAGPADTFEVLIDGVGYQENFDTDIPTTLGNWITTHTAALTALGLTATFQAPDEVLIEGSLTKPTFVLSAGVVDITLALGFAAATFATVSSAIINNPQLQGFYPSIFKNNTEIIFGNNMSLGEFCNNC